MELTQQDLLHLRAACGWLELGNHLEANAELEQVTPKLRVHPAVLQLRWEIRAAAKKWDACVEIARTLAELLPENPGVWVQCGISLYYNGQTQAAYDLTAGAIERFSDNWNLVYNQACYACQLGRLEEAWTHLETAFAIGDSKAIKLQALDDPDLEPLWQAIGKL